MGECLIMVWSCVMVLVWSVGVLRDCCCRRSYVQLDMDMFLMRCLRLCCLSDRCYNKEYMSLRHTKLHS
jgi:hypothetical protein